MLLWWKGVPVSKMENIANRCILHKQFAEGGAEEVSIPTPWMENDQFELNALRNAPIKMADISLDIRGMAYQKMSAKEKVDFKQKMVEMYEMGADDGQPLPPSLTPI
jgi:hypothetical protein